MRALYGTHLYAVVAQSVVRRIGSAEVTGSIPVSSLNVNSQDFILGVFYSIGNSFGFPIE